MQCLIEENEFNINFLIKYFSFQLSKIIKFIYVNGKFKLFLLNNNSWIDYSRFESSTVIEDKIMELIDQEIYNIFQNYDKMPPYINKTEYIRQCNKYIVLKNYLEIYGIHNSIYSKITDEIMIID